ncbi:MAG: hypothetical protein HZC51_03940 [Nitrospirae bacterium]|nr:hypothetical protein [Nitrospirota bacterium]
MRTCSVYALGIFIVMGLFTQGCGGAHLYTKVEVYNPTARLEQLNYEEKHKCAWTPKKQALKSYLEKRIAQENLAAQNPIPWMHYLTDVIESLNENAPQPLITYLKSKEGMEHKSSETVRKNCNNASNNATKQLDDLEKRINGGKISNETAYMEIKDIISIFFKDFNAALAIDSSGSEKLGVMGVVNRTAAEFGPILKSLVEDAGVQPGEKIDVESLIKHVHVGIKKSMSAYASQDNIERPDSVTETTSDPLVVLANSDVAGWTDAVTRTDVDARGNCEYVIIRDSPSSFNVFSVHNDPTRMARATLNMAESTLGVIAQIASSYAGLPIKLQGKPSTPAEISPMSGSLFTTPQLKTMAKARITAVEDLSSRIPKKADGEIDMSKITDDDLERWVSDITMFSKQSSLMPE